MKHRLNWTVLLLALLFTLGWTTYGRGEKPYSEARFWDYKLVSNGGRISEANLNALGAQGWELVSVSEAIFNSATGQTEPIYYFKRAR